MHVSPRSIILALESAGVQYSVKTHTYAHIDVHLSITIIIITTTSIAIIIIKFFINDVQLLCRDAYVVYVNCQIKSSAACGVNTFRPVVLSPRTKPSDVVVCCLTIPCLNNEINDD